MVKLLVFLVALAAFAWYPFISAEEAMTLVEARVLKMQQTIPDLCPMSVHRDTIRKVPFGYTEEVSYDCSRQDPVYGISKSTDVVFITFYKGLINMPNKALKNRS